MPLQKIHLVCLKVDLLVETWSQLDSCRVTRLHLAKLEKKTPNPNPKKKFTARSQKRVNKRTFMEYIKTFLEFNNNKQSTTFNKYPLLEADPHKNQYSLKTASFETNLLIINASTLG